MIKEEDSWQKSRFLYSVTGDLLILEHAQNAGLDENEMAKMGDDNY